MAVFRLLLVGLAYAAAWQSHRLPGTGIVASRASLAMSAADDPARWAIFKDAEGVPMLRPSGPGYAESTEVVRVERTPERPGLGLVLVEHGGAADGSAALVLISEVAPDSNAALYSSAPLLPGDALMYVGAPGAGAKGEAIRVEGRSYDDTVEAIGSIQGPIELFVKRLRVRPKARPQQHLPDRYPGPIYRPLLLVPVIP